VTPCSDVVGYHRFGGPCCLHLQGEYGGSIVLRNLVIATSCLCPSVGTAGNALGMFTTVYDVN
jgi:hypothetical protein